MFINIIHMNHVHSITDDHTIQMTFEAAPDVSLQIFHSFCPSAVWSNLRGALLTRLMCTPCFVDSQHKCAQIWQYMSWQCLKVSPMAISRLRRVLQKSGCSRMMVTSLIGYLQDDEVCLYPHIIFYINMLLGTNASHTHRTILTPLYPPQKKLFIFSKKFIHKYSNSSDLQ